MSKTSKTIFLVILAILIISELIPSTEESKLIKVNKFHSKNKFRSFRSKFLHSNNCRAPYLSHKRRPRPLTVEIQLPKNQNGPWTHGQTSYGYVPQYSSNSHHNLVLQSNGVKSNLKIKISRMDELVSNVK